MAKEAGGSRESNMRYMFGYFVCGKAHMSALP